jgi:8-oxo-dGTP pyrophosphatase MutT (NUDIX family)
MKREHEPEEFDEIATLCYVMDRDEVLLIEQKRGIGKGNINGPGGKVEAQDNSIKEAAIREVKEEVEVTPKNVEKVGEVDFIFGDNPFHQVHVYITDEYSGEPVETEEAVPEWVSVDEIPYERMWPDDRYWMPLMFEGIDFEAVFQFDGNGEEIQDWMISNLD